MDEVGYRINCSCVLELVFWCLIFTKINMLSTFELERGIER